MPLVQDNSSYVQSPIMSPVGPAPMPMPQNFGGSKYGDTTSLYKTIAIVVLSIVTVTFICLFIWAMHESSEAKTDVDSKISTATAAAVAETHATDLKECNEKLDAKTKHFSGPADYGDLSFDYPRDWSVYIANDPLKGGDFEAYFNKDIVDSIDSSNSIYALRVSILRDTFEDVVADYQREMDKRDANLTVESITLANGTMANKYTGTIPGTDFSGYIVVFKIRDKTAILQTYVADYSDRFETILKTVTFKA